MKKQIFSLYLALLALLSTPAQASPLPLAADGAPEFLPIQSVTVLKGFMQEQVTDSHISMWAMSMSEVPGSATYFNLKRRSDESPTAFGQRTTAQRFSFNILDTRDLVSVYAALWMEWRGTFYPAFDGNASTVVTDLPGGGTGFNMPNIKMKLSYTSYIPAGNLTSAYMVKRDEYGNYQYAVQLNVINGLIEFPSHYAGTDGLVVGTARNANGEYFQVAYDKKDNGQRVPPINVVGTTNGFIDNSFDTSVVAQPGVVSFMFFNGIAQWGNTPPVIRLTVTGTSSAELRIVSGILDQTDAFIGSPYFGTLVKVGDPSGQAQRLSIQNGTLKLVLAPGTYLVGLENPEIWTQYRPQPSSTDNNQDGGKG